MCGRFALGADADSINAHFNITNSTVLTPRYNIAPNQVIPTIRYAGTLEFLTWGLRPRWLKPDQTGFINARVETLTEKPAFRNAFKKQRCLVVADGYYEWKQVGNTKQPFLICLPQKQIFAFAALWDGDTCALITKAAEHEMFKKLHDRMPVIIAPHEYQLWLTPSTPVTSLLEILSRNNLQDLQIMPVSTKVNNPQNDFIECITPLH